MAIDPQLIEDETLRGKVIDLGMTLPHPESVLDPAIGDYAEQFYYRLIAQEAYTYEHSEQYETMNSGSGSGTAGIDQYQPYWQSYNDALMGYINHAPLSKQKIKDFIQGLFSFLSVHNSRGVGDPSLVEQSNAKNIFVMNGYFDTVAGYSLEYFDDFVPADPMATPEPTQASAERLEAQPPIVEEAWDKDAAKIDSLLSQFVDILSDVTMQAAFSNPGDVGGSGKPPTPTESWDKIFDELNWLWFIDTFGSNVNVPPRPEPMPPPGEQTQGDDT